MKIWPFLVVKIVKIIQNASSLSLLYGFQFQWSCLIDLGLGLGLGLGIVHNSSSQILEIWNLKIWTSYGEN